jgi:hypothetical protein
MVRRERKERTYKWPKNSVKEKQNVRERKRKKSPTDR